MTSSLVGSEMCIRDSGGDDCGEDLSSIARVEDMSCPFDFGAPVFLLPVSYTHLTLPTICSV
eukprot:4519498-Prorocentrum_lima.AAC.1